MEELFQYMKTLRSQINDVADQTEKLSVEEHMNCTTIETLQKDLDSANEATRLFKEETAQMTKVKAEICSQILDKQRRIALLQSDSRTLSQTMELMRQEKLSLSKKLEDKSAHYNKISEDISVQLRKQQELIKSQNAASQMEEGLVNEKIRGGKGFHDGTDRMEIDGYCDQAKIDEIEQLKEKTKLENNKLRQSIELMKTKIGGFKKELIEMDERMLEEEIQALISDKGEEAKSTESMQQQIRRLKDFSHAIVCSCGEEYTVTFDV